MLEKVLVCLDGSPIAERILPHIVEEGRRRQSEVVLLRAVSLPGVTLPVNIPGGPGTAVLTAGAMERARSDQDAATQYLEGVAERLRQQGLKVEVVVLPGAAGSAIVNYARDNGVTLIAIASHGHGGLRRLTIGSTADYVLRNATVPVLMVTSGAA